jgi:hypothetical protein
LRQEWPLPDVVCTHISLRSETPFSGKPAINSSNSFSDRENERKISSETEMEDSLSKLSASAADGPNDAAAGVGLGLSCRISHSAASEYFQLFKVSSFKAQLVDRSAVASSTTSLLFQTFITLSG